MKARHEDVSIMTGLLVGSLLGLALIATSPWISLMIVGVIVAATCMVLAMYRLSRSR